MHITVKHCRSLIGAPWQHFSVTVGEGTYMEDDEDIFGEEMSVQFTRPVDGTVLLSRQKTRTVRNVCSDTAVAIKNVSSYTDSAVSSPQDCSKRFILYFPDRPVQSDTISTSLGSIQPYATLNARRLLKTHIHQCL